MSEDAFVSGLLSAVPESQIVLDEHHRCYEELILHLLMADLARFAYAAFRAKRIGVVSRLLDYVDQALRAGDAPVENAVCLSFVEHFTLRNPGQQRFIATWPGALKAEAQRQARWVL